MKKSIPRFLITSTIALSVCAICFLSFWGIERLIIEESQMIAHDAAENLLPFMLSGDMQQVDKTLKNLATHPCIQRVELVGAAGVELASYVREEKAGEPTQNQLELAPTVNFPANYDLLVTVPLAFDTQILANLHVAANLWPAYSKIMQRAGLLLLFGAILCTIMRQLKGKIRFEKTNPGKETELSSCQNIHRLLQEALQDSDISLGYQPIERMGGQGIYGAEIFVCWRHPSGQTLHISPSDFIAFAEKSGFCLPFDCWIFETASRQFAKWQHQYGPLVLGINITLNQLRDPNFQLRVREACALSQFAYQLIEFEISESELLRTCASIVDIERVIQPGLNLTIDGFGFSIRSHALLEKLSISKIKLAPQLIKNLAQDPEIYRHLQSFERLAFERDIQITADGVCNEDQALMLEQLGCVQGQGAYFSQILPPQQFEELLKDKMH